MELSDNQLVSLIRGGDRNVFAILLERYSSQIYNLMYRYCGTSEEAADLTQDVFCKAFEKLGSYRRQVSFFSWLYTLALNHARDWSRKRTNHEQTHEKLKLEEEPGVDPPEGKVESSEQTRQLMHALNALPFEHKEMVLLRYRHECSIRELAEIFNLSESAVKMRLHRSLAEMKQNLLHLG